MIIVIQMAHKTFEVITRGGWGWYRVD